MSGRAPRFVDGIPREFARRHLVASEGIAGEAEAASAGAVHHPAARYFAV